MGEWLLALLAVVLTVGTAVFVATEFSLVALDRPTVQQAIDSGDTRARGVLASLRRLSTQLSAEHRSRRYRGVATNGDHLYYNSYTVLNLGAQYRLNDHLTISGRVNNLLNKRYATYVVGSEDAFPGGVIVSPGDDMSSARFLAPGAGRSITVGLRYEWR